MRTDIASMATYRMYYSDNRRKIMQRIYVFLTKKWWHSQIMKEWKNWQLTCIVTTQQRSKLYQIISQLILGASQIFSQRTGKRLMHSIKFHNSQQTKVPLLKPQYQLLHLSWEYLLKTLEDMCRVFLADKSHFYLLLL